MASGRRPKARPDGEDQPDTEREPRERKRRGSAVTERIKAIAAEDRKQEEQEELYDYRKVRPKG